MTALPRLLLFTRYAQAGRCKTRLIPVLGPQEAARLQQRLTERMVDEAITLQNEHVADLAIHYHGASEETMAAWLGQLSFYPQPEGDLGQRMAAAFTTAFAEGAKAAILFGTDIPDLGSTILRQALTALDGVPALVGPTLDGGYYLIGLTASSAAQALPLLFADIPWSTSLVLATTLDRLRQGGLDYTLLPELRDIDSPEDLFLARAHGLL
jgi:uncharacterized protein